jgi:aspartate-semialdehyde dehydrogenase
MELERKDEYTVAVVGATGAVGREMLATLARLEFPVGALRALASARSAGKELPWAGGHVVVEDLEAADLSGIDIALFSAGGSTSKAWAPRFVEAGAIVVDNSSAWRMDASVPLVVPEVNPDALDGHAGIIANPNCSTIQMVVALKPIHDAAGIERVVVSTYQSASGAGQQGIDELMADVAAALGTGEEPERAKFAHPLAFEALPHIDVFMDGGYTREELKMLHETRKIMGLPELDVSATCVRVPVVRGHSEAVTLDLGDALTGEAARALLAGAPGVTLVDDPARAAYPLARVSEGEDAVFVGRVRQDLNRPRTLHMWVVSDNLLKGAALNAVQIAQALVSRATQGDR